MNRGTRKITCPHCGKTSYQQLGGEQIPSALLPLIAHLWHWTSHEVEGLLKSVKQKQWETAEEQMRRLEISDERIAKMKAEVLCD